MTNERKTDAEFVARLLAKDAFPGQPAPASGHLSDRILADFDRIATRRRRGLFAVLRAGLQMAWPGASLWQPGMALAASLACGLIVGAMMAPSPAADASVVATSQTADTTIPVSDMLGDLS